MTDYATAPMTPKIALDLAIFAINTFMHPDASAAKDVDVLEARSDEVMEALSVLRSSPYLVLSDDEKSTLDQWHERQAELATDGEYTPEEAARLAKLMEG